MVDEDLCVECGKCEKHYPVSTHAAIRVISYGERRARLGTAVITIRKRNKIIQIRKNRTEE